MQAVDFLSQVRRLDALIDNKREEERELWALATSMAQRSDGMPHATGQTDKMTNIVQKIINAQERTNAAIDKYVDAKQEVLKRLETLPRKQYEVLYWLYIKKRVKREKGQKPYYTWSEAAEGLGITEQAMSKTRRRGIRNLQKILDSEQGLIEVE